MNGSNNFPTFKVAGWFVVRYLCSFNVFNFDKRINSSRFFCFSWNSFGTTHTRIQPTLWWSKPTIHDNNIIKSFDVFSNTWNYQLTNILWGINYHSLPFMWHVWLCKKSVLYLDVIFCIKWHFGLNIWYYQGFSRKWPISMSNVSFYTQWRLHPRNAKT